MVTRTSSSANYVEHGVYVSACNSSYKNITAILMHLQQRFHLLRLMAEKSHKEKRHSPYKIPHSVPKTRKLKQSVLKKSEDAKRMPEPKPLYFYYHSETTGGNPHSDQIIQIAATMHNLADQADSRFSQLIEPTYGYTSTRGKCT